MPEPAGRRFLRRLYRTAVDAVRPEPLVRRWLRVTEGRTLLIGPPGKAPERVHRLGEGGRVFVFGSGKAALGMGQGTVAALGGLVAGGLLIAPHSGTCPPLEVMAAEHPVPGRGSVAAGDRLLADLAEPGPEDFVCYLLSGGSSALLEKPVPPVTLAELQELTRMLLRRGVPIHELNVVRKHLSLVKGGRLAACLRAPAAVLVISDVIGDDLAIIGSGPFTADPSTYADARQVLVEAGVWEQAPASVRVVIERGMGKELAETPSAIPASVSQHIIGANRIALEAAAAACRQRGVPVHLLSSRFNGEARELGRFLVAVAQEILASSQPFSPPVCLLAGGETTVTVQGKGTGGRNHEVALGALLALGEDAEGISLLAAGTDGVDGTAQAAGAFADALARRRAADLGLDLAAFLAANDSAGFFAKIGGQVGDGPTGTNVMDFVAVLVGDGQWNQAEETAR